MRHGAAAAASVRFCGRVAAATSRSPPPLSAAFRLSVLVSHTTCNGLATPLAPGRNRAHACAVTKANCRFPVRPLCRYIKSNAFMVIQLFARYARVRSRSATAAGSRRRCSWLESPSQFPPTSAPPPPPPNELSHFPMIIKVASGRPNLSQSLFAAFVCAIMSWYMKLERWATCEWRGG